MLVSSIARFNAINTMNKAGFGVMQTASQMNYLMNSSAFGGEHDLSLLNQMDKKLSLDLESNKLLYKISYMQEKMAAKHQDLNNNNNKKSLNILA